jgi:hypothetical protein
MKITRLTRAAGWLAVAGLLGAALISPSGVLATGAQGGGCGEPNGVGAQSVCTHTTDTKTECSQTHH